MNHVAYQALRETAAWIYLNGRGKIWAAGEDRARLLHAMTSNNVQQLQPGRGCYALFLNPQGRILADVNIFALEDRLLLDLESEVNEKIYAHLDHFIIADDVILEDVTQSLSTISLEGPEADGVLAGLDAPVPVAPHAIVPWDDGFVARISSTGANGFFLFLPTERKDEILIRLEAGNVPQADSGAAETVRLEHRKPRYGVDFSESQIPQETQLMSAISFSKGCYIGQEIVERVRSRGRLNRYLVPLELEGAEPVPANTRITAGEKEVGTVTSSAYSPAEQKVIGLGYLRTEMLAAKDLMAASAAVTVAALPAQS